MNIYSSIIHKSQKLQEPKCLSTEEWMNQMWHIHTPEYYSAKEKNEVLMSAVPQMYCEDMRISERSQSQKSYIA